MFRIQAKCMLLGRVLSHRQPVRNCFRCELVAEAGLIAQSLIYQKSSETYPYDFVIPKGFSPEESAVAADTRKYPYKFPRNACSRSIDSNSALKLPLPKPRLPRRSMIS